MIKMENRVGFIKKPENVETGNILFGLFESKNTTFLNNINEFIQSQNWRDDKGKEINKFSGSLKDFLELARINKSNKITVIKALKESALSNSSQEQREEYSGFLPLSYINIINKSGAITKNDDSLMQVYENYWNSLPLEERKFYKFNDEIVVDRQSPDPGKQAVVEAVSNALDALRETQIGEKGLGVKQFLSYLDKGGKISVESKKEGKKANKLDIVLGADGNYYEKIQKIKNFPNSSGTILSLSLEEPLSSERIREIEEQVKETFRLTLGVQLILNNEVINHYDKITNLKGEQASEYQATKIVRINITNDKIEIIDGGRGMDSKTLSRMFIARSGTKEMVVDKSKSNHDLWLLEDEQNKRKIFFSRSSEILELADYNTDDFLNCAESGILIESSAFRVPDSRQNIFIDEQFLNVITNTSLEILDSEKDPEEKIRLLNSILVYLENKMKEGNLGDDTKNKEQNSKIILCIEKIKKQAQFTVEQLQDKYILIPNEKEWQKIGIKSDKEAFYINKMLFDLDIEQLPNIERVEYFQGARVFSIDIKEQDPKEQKFIKYRDIYIFDKSVLEAFEKENNVFRKDTLKTLIELSLNPIITSYDEQESHVNKNIKITEKKENIETLQKNEILNGVASSQFLMNFEKLN
jgi:hypothetical protein